ncbi:MAG: N-acetylmuramoyl-L-alanine amidase, partial [Clostridia bacterium]|nr:N-acetylmuramoyl-L-alanine amidase [Clostridia bacterium]
TKKTGDLAARVACMKEHPGALFISIHMNTLPQEKYSGLQVFYSDRDPGSRLLAQALQDAARELLQPDNRREIKNGGRSIYVLERASGQAVLVECGFLSNKAEAAKLADEGYRRKLAYVLSRGILSYAAGNEGEKL